MYVISDSKKINIKICKSFKDRLMGMMFITKKLNYGLCFPKCNSIHTFFMFQKIDVIMTNKENKVLYIKKGVPTWHIIKPIKKVYYTYEFSEGIINDVKLNEYFQVKLANKNQ